MSSQSQPVATRKFAKALKNITLILRLGSTNRSDVLQEAPFQDPPATASSVCYVVPSPPTSPFNPTFEPIPEGKEARSAPQSDRFDLRTSILQPSHSSKTHPYRLPERRSSKSTSSSPRSNFTASPSSSPRSNFTASPSSSPRSNFTTGSSKFRGQALVTRPFLNESSLPHPPHPMQRVPPRNNFFAVWFRRALHR
ncbi:hypothetical protein M407DRAFT_122070 [Tulasnella calospora MUT 4182]|uniref:Uncharacterized protein n=1 Tax=Tulasnella calospora MUT 4182 TaxID=1051891 RepID=A0A0C3MDU0_9AGAM|nr:hypothetical protein M407DRAFT_122070 [Tulasnella calospora MUT 4182]